MTKNKPTGAQVVAKAKSYVGKYAKHCNKFTKYYAGHWGIPKNGRIEAGYCTVFAGYVLDHVGAGDQLPKKQLKALGKKWWNTQHLWAYFKDHGKTTTDPAKAKIGALAFKKVGSTKKKTTGHTSIFWKYENGYVYTIDGNVGGGVKVRRKKANWYVGFVNLDYAKPEYNKARFGMEYLRITATPTSTAAHLACKLDFPVDVAGNTKTVRDWWYNKFGSKMVVIRRYPKASNMMIIRTKKKVLIPRKGDKPVYLYMMVEHQDAVEMKKINETYPVNGKICREGHNSGSGTVGDHLHVSFGYSTKKITAKTIGSGWRSCPGWSFYHPDITRVKIEDAVYIDKSFTTVLDTKGIKFKTV